MVVALPKNVARIILRSFTHLLIGQDNKTLRIEGFCYVCEVVNSFVAKNSSKFFS